MLALVRYLVAAVAASVTLLAVTAVPAHASIWQFSDGFEGDTAATRWFFDGEGDRGGVIANGGRSGEHSASWSVMGSGWSSVGQRVRITPAIVHTPTCGVSFYEQRATANPNLTVEIIDLNTWTYIATFPTTGPAANDSSWRRYVVGTWRATTPDVFVRFVITSKPGYLKWTFIDDVVVSCSY
jgi:hypothetical protein